MSPNTLREGEKKTRRAERGNLQTTSQKRMNNLMASGGQVQGSFLVQTGEKKQAAKRSGIEKRGRGGVT